MKTKLFLLILLLVIPFGCKEEKKIEIIPDYDKIYLPPNQLTEIAQLIEGNDQQLLDSIFHLYEKMFSFEENVKNEPTIE